MTNALILDSFRHNAWATRRLIEVCRPLRTDQLAATGVGTYGDIPTTLDHIVRCDADYARGMARFAGVEHVELSWLDGAAEVQRDLEVIDGRAVEVAGLWEATLATEVDPEDVVAIDGGAHQCRIGIFFAQAINHANHHREQVCAILTGLGLTAPDIQAWEYAWSRGRLWDTPG